MSTPMMKCGHSANATCNGMPCCVICSFSGPGSEKAFIVVDTPNLTDRMMKCSYTTGRNGETHKPVPSDSEAAFFRHNPDKPMDEYYCGCWGWD